MTRVNFEIPNDVHHSFKIYAEEHNISLKKLLIESTRKVVSRVKIPNAETVKAIMDTRNNKNLTTCKDVDDLFAKLGIVNE